MAKKAFNRSEINALRYGDVAEADLREMSKVLSTLSAQFEACAVAVKTMKIDKITVDGATKFDRGIELVNQYLEAVDIAFAKAKHRR